ncbi:MAG: hypothetical protein KJO07_06600, partial [Deltaproteobacteria bacterium]|nr:hypothetical protein [Deltaproteobacteria bacterium]
MTALLRSAAVIATLVVVPGPVAAEKIFVAPVGGQGVAAAELNTVRDSARRHLQARGFTVVVG